MFRWNRILLICSAVVVYSSCITAFFFNWGSPVGTQKPYIARWPVFQERTFQPPSYGVNSPPEPDTLPVQIPAVPIQVPLRAQFSSASDVHNVQLVPCLCPVSQDIDYNNPQDVVYLNQIKPNNNNQ